MTMHNTRTRFTSGAIGVGGAWLLRTRWLMRAPIWLYRARLGFVFGSRMLMLEHIGRTSGTRRHVVLEVVDRPTPQTYVVVSGFGERSQWLRNITAEPRVRVSVSGHRPTPAIARRLTVTEARASIERYTYRHRRAWQTFKPVIENTFGAPIDENNPDLPMVALHLSPPSRPRSGDHEDTHNPAPDGPRPPAQR